MKTLVIDASVAAKWFLPEDGAEHTKALLDSAHLLIAPDLLWIEVAQVAWKLARRGLLDPVEAARVVQDMWNLPVESRESTPLLQDAIVMALKTDRTVYDCLYLALAIAQDALLVTADRRFATAIAGPPDGSGPGAGRVRLLGDVL